MSERKQEHHGNQTGKRGQGPKDINQIAFAVVQQAIGEAPRVDAPKKESLAVTMGRVGGLKGGKARAEKLTPEQRKAIAKKAAETRWNREAT
jgi:hypothetical protein